MLIDEAFFAVEHVDVRARHFTMHQQRQPGFGQRFDRREDIVDAGDARVGVGRGAGRIELGSEHDAAGLGRMDVFGAGAVGEVQHHQGLETAAGRTRREDALAVGFGFMGGTYRRNQIGHDDGAGEGTRHVADGMSQHSSIAQMDVPVVGTQEGQAIGHWGFQAVRTQPPMLPENPESGTAIKFSSRRPIACR